MKLLFVGEFAGFAGGIERYMYQAAELMRERGHRIYGLFEMPGKDQNEFCKVFESTHFLDALDSVPEDIDIAIIHKIREPEALSAIMKRFPVISVIHDHEYYCPRHSLYYPFVHKNCHYTTSRLLCGLCGMTRSCRAGFAERANDSFIKKPRVWNLICASSYLVVLSDFMRNLAITNGAPAEKTEIIYPYIKIPAKTERKQNRAEAHLLVAGQLIRGKGVDLLLSAVPHIKGNFTVDILGSGEEEENLRHLSKPLSIDGKVKFHSWANHPERFFADAALAVLPWRWQEPFGLVGPEALANGIPLVGFDIGGIREYLIDGSTGLLVPYGDIKRLAAAVSQLLVDVELRRQMGANGRVYVQANFGRESFLGNWEYLLQEVKSPGVPAAEFLKWD